MPSHRFYVAEQLCIGQIDFRRMSTRSTVTGTYVNPDCRAVTFYRTAADGHHQHRRRAVGLVSDSRFKRPKSVGPRCFCKLRNIPFPEPESLAHKALCVPHPVTKSGEVAAHDNLELPGLIPILRAEPVGPSQGFGILTHGIKDFSLSRISPGDAALSTYPSAMIERPLS